MSNKGNMGSFSEENINLSQELNGHPRNKEDPYPD
jgi:hypothetical protein